MAKKLMDENPITRQAEGKDKSEKSQITAPVKKSLGVPTTPTAKSDSGFDTVKQINRALPADYPEQARRKNSAARDARTNLGRGIPSTPVVD